MNYFIFEAIKILNGDNRCVLNRSEKYKKGCKCDKCMEVKNDASKTKTS